MFEVSDLDIEVGMESRGGDDKRVSDVDIDTWEPSEMINKSSLDKESAGSLSSDSAPTPISHRHPSRSQFHSSLTGGDRVDERNSVVDAYIRHTSASPTKAKVLAKILTPDMM